MKVEVDPLGFLICVFVVALGATVWHAGRLIFRILMERWGRALDARIDARLELFFARDKTNVSQTKQETVANEMKTVNNVADGTPEPEEPPFWDNREKLQRVKESIEREGFDPDLEPDLSQMTPHEAWKEIDARLLELDDQNK